MKWNLTEDVYENFSSNKEMFDFSNYLTKSKYHDDLNKLVIGKVKDETTGFVIEEFVGLKSKMFSYLVDDNSEHKKTKGDWGIWWHSWIKSVWDIWWIGC